MSVVADDDADYDGNDDNDNADNSSDSYTDHHSG